ncbi:hypothetical protein C0081_07810 [Cohaesibacter celericrescens]|uniref:Uncharacterized protein n=1 Tax=Cohaesibacter celericrescens TaxID=2067669 RepID=A0A2N5XTJ8_9HYPH|nr:hypothetical protein C0081_07810 [Cohaesibacter celericrescens]
MLWLACIYQELCSVVLCCLGRSGSPELVFLIADLLRRAIFPFVAQWKKLAKYIAWPLDYEEFSRF